MIEKSLKIFFTINSKPRGDNKVVSGDNKAIHRANKAVDNKVINQLTEKWLDGAKLLYADSISA